MPAEKEKILIVDDEEITLDLLVSSTNPLNLKPKLTRDAESAWEYFLAESPRLIVLDWTLPGMSGIELCKKMRASKIGKYLAILMVTSHDQPEDMEMALEAGANFYMVKPVQPQFYQAWISSARKHIKDLRKLEKSDEEIRRIKTELEDVNEQLEASIAQANQLTMDTERAYIEVNQVFKTVAGGILVIDNEYNIIKHNKNFLDMLDEEIDSAINKKCHEVFPSPLCNTPECPVQRLNSSKAAESIESHIVKELDDGSTIHYSVVSTPLRGLVGEKMGIVEHVTDITQRVAAEEALKESEKRYRELSTVDELTGLFNKRYFNRSLQLELDRVARYGHALSLVMMDIDNFKHHNDTYGHAEGDKVLARLGGVIKHGLRSNDVACRYGGEEFAIILPATEVEGAMVVAERVRKNFAAADFCDHKVHKTLSLGITQYVAGDNKEIFIKRADAGLYEAKTQGKNRSIIKKALTTVKPTP